MGATNADRRLLARRFELRWRRLLRTREIASGAHRFWRLAWDTNVTGMSAMLAYNMLLAVVPVALLGLFVAGQVLSSAAVQQSVLSDLRHVFPGAAEHTLNSLLNEIRSSTTSTGVLALIASLWLGSSFWGALDTAFSRIYRCRARNWLEQKRFSLAMLGVVLVFMVATVVVPTAAEHPRRGGVGPAVRSVARGRGRLPDLAGDQPGAAVRVPDGDLPARAQPAGALASRVAGGDGGDDRDLGQSTTRSRRTSPTSRRSPGLGPRSCSC